MISTYSLYCLLILCINGLVTAEDVSPQLNPTNLSNEHTVGRDRPRSYVFLPGRKLQVDRNCRPYEVLARHGRCIRKLGKTGLYAHRDHVYG